MSRLDPNRSAQILGYSVACLRCDPQREIAKTAQPRRRLLHSLACASTSVSVNRAGGRKVAMSRGLTISRSPEVSLSNVLSRLNPEYPSLGSHRLQLHARVCVRRASATVEGIICELGLYEIMALRLRSRSSSGRSPTFGTRMRKEARRRSGYSRFRQQ